MGTGANDFPRTMTKGLFRGRTFQTWAEYQQALKGVRDPTVARRKAPAPQVEVGSYRIEVRTDTTHIVVEGEVGDDVQEVLLDAIAKLPT